MHADSTHAGSRFPPYHGAPHRRHIHSDEMGITVQLRPACISCQSVRLILNVNIA